MGKRQAKKGNFTMADSLTANPITPYTSAPSGPSTSSITEFEDHPRGRSGRRRGNHDNDDEDDEYYSSGEEEYDDDSDEDEDEDDESDDGGEGSPMSLDELLYSASSYHAIVRPVSAAMILAALASVFINTQATLEAGQQQFASAYNVWQLDDSSSIGKNLAMSIANTFIMVLVIGTMTFGIVLLYKYRCMKCLIGYMMFSSASLLGLLGDYMFSLAIEIYQIPIDVISYTVMIYNFAIVGVISIFYQKGIPNSVTQTYLVCTSVILAWHFAHFDDWTAWTLLVMLALYDLCAVLTPCGPLKALVNLMQDKDAPEMPGLLYEAQLPAGTQKPGNRQRSQNNINANKNESSTPARATPSSVPGSQEDNNRLTASNSGAVSGSSEMPPPPVLSEENHDESSLTHGPRVFLPLAIAKVYRLPLVSRQSSSPSPSSKLRRKKSARKSRKGKGGSSTINESPLLADNSNDQGESIEDFYNKNFSVNELLSEVEVELPRNGGRIERMEENQNKFAIIGKNGELKRELYMNKKGKVYDVTDDDDDESVFDEDPSSIRLGLGDFIFYSVLVSKAALYSFTTFAACMLVILAGLGATLVFLSVFHSALPALPVSIFLGVIFYLLTRVLIEPWIEQVLTVPVYV